MSRKKIYDYTSNPLRKYLSDARDCAGNIMGIVKAVLDEEKLTWEEGTSDDEISVNVKPSRLGKLKGKIFAKVNEAIPSGHASLLLDVMPSVMSKNVVIRLRRK